MVVLMRVFTWAAMMLAVAGPPVGAVDEPIAAAVAARTQPSAHAAPAAVPAAAAQEAAPAPRIIRVSAERFAFTPSEIVVERGTTIEFHLVSEDTDHGFRIVGTPVDVSIPKRRRGETVVAYTADTPGRYVIECSRPCGAGHTAMRALLIVK
jgi:heme/copper-type cytochrome/quinol oxidase subunit 2